MISMRSEADQRVKTWQCFLAITLAILMCTELAHGLRITAKARVSTRKKVSKLCSISPPPKGRWIYHNHQNVSTIPQFETLSGYNSAFEYPFFCYQKEGQLRRALEIFSYQWVPDSCKLFNFRPGPMGDTNAGALLKKMSRAKIVFVGDSLINEQYGSLKAMLGSAVEESYTQYVYVNGVRHHNGIAGFRARGGMEVWYCSHAHLVQPGDGGFRVEEYAAHANASSGEIGWGYRVNTTGHLLNSTPYAHLLTGDNTYVILSTGPHWKDYSTEQYTLMVKNVLGYLRRNFRGKRVYIRSVAPGHPDCDGVQAPVPGYRHDEEQWYNWGNFKRYNKIWEQAVLSMKDGRFVYFDIWDMSLPRVDAHTWPGKPDCLHYCEPGVPDYWNFLLASSWMSA